MTYEQILYDVSDRIATVTLNRPERLNAWTPVMEKEVLHAIEVAEKDDEVRVIILTGAGRGFCAGADLEALAWMKDLDLSTVDPKEIAERIAPDPGRTNARPDFAKTHSYFPSVSKPILGAINGPCVGLGLVLALYCDLRFASETAKFSTAFSRRGLIAEYGISWMLPRLVGLSDALDLLFSARMVGAEEALRMGMVSRVVPGESLNETVREYAAELALQVSPRSLKVIKQQVYDSLLQSLEESIDAANGQMFGAFASEDFKEGVSHFLEKRPARFTGK
jgi:enoyl-CoA hydratase/carnithine racemase